MAAAVVAANASDASILFISGHPSTALLSRMSAARSSHEALLEPMGRALDAVSRRDALFEHCGYDVVHHPLQVGSTHRARGLFASPLVS